MAESHYTTGEAAELAGIGASTARDYLKAHPEFFSEEATPDKGGRRLFVWSDIETLATIYRLRRAGKDPEEITAELASGERDPVQRPGGGGPGPAAVDEEDVTGPGSELAIRLSAAAAQWQSTAETLAEERNYLREELNKEREARITAEKEAAAAKAALEMTTNKKSFLDRLLGR